MNKFQLIAGNEIEQDDDKDIHDENGIKWSEIYELLNGRNLNISNSIDGVSHFPGPECCAILDQSGKKIKSNERLTFNFFKEIDSLGIYVHRLVEPWDFNVLIMRKDGCKLMLIGIEYSDNERKVNLKWRIC